LKGLKQRKIWDPVTRLWHWILVISVTAGLLMGEFMSFSNIQWHFYAGYLTGSLLLFRLIWGLIGPEPIRLSRLIPTPSATIAYLKRIGSRSPSGSPGHNPLGSLSVVAIILLLSGQVITGLFIESDDFFESGPLAYYASEAIVSRMTWLHHLISKGVFSIIAIHISAILFYLFWKRENLIRPMITGLKWVKMDKSDDSPL
jgi:cytochrome b